ncbi:MAG TPA: MBG domain-containing protein, partial [Candidatus Limnocylindrales bacterium]|nr:MBG domain-containing protein [Candidatus Limnocylindrales bacterium]
LGGSLGFTTAATAASPVGTYPVSAAGLTSADYTITFVPGSLSVEPAGQSIDFDVLPPATYGDSSMTLTATSSAGLPITYTTTGPCSVSGTTLTITGAGTCTVTAHQDGDANHDAATDVSQSFVVAKATPSVTWYDPDNITYGTALSDAQLDALASVAGTYVYGPAAGEVLDAGTHTLVVTFTPTDGANYESVTLTVEITVEPAAQSIDFDALPPATNGDGSIELTATSSAGLPITYTTTGPCSVSGTTLTITGAGTCTVTAHQEGDANHEAAESVTVAFAITQPSIALPNTSALEQQASPPGFTLMIGGLFAFVLAGIVVLPARERRRLNRPR